MTQKIPENTIIRELYEYVPTHSLAQLIQSAKIQIKGFTGKKHPPRQVLLNNLKTSQSMNKVKGFFTYCMQNNDHLKALAQKECEEIYQLFVSLEELPAEIIPYFLCGDETAKEKGMRLYELVTENDFFTTNHLSEDNVESEEAYGHAKKVLAVAHGEKDQFIEACKELLQDKDPDKTILAVLVVQFEAIGKQIAKVEKLEAEAEKLRTKLETEKSEKTKYKNATKELEKQLAPLEKRLPPLENSNRVQLQAIEQLHKERDSQKNKIRELNDKISHKNTELFALERKVRELEEQLETQSQAPQQTTLTAPPVESPAEEPSKREGTLPVLIISMEQEEMEEGASHYQPTFIREENLSESLMGAFKDVWYVANEIKPKTRRFLKRHRTSENLREFETIATLRNQLYK